MKKKIKISDFDWSGWAEIPSESVLNDWNQVRLIHRAPITQSVLNSSKIHANKIVNEGLCSIDFAISLCCDNGWRGLRYEYILNGIRKHQSSYTAIPTGNNVVPISNRSTRDTSLQQELNDTSWAK